MFVVVNGALLAVKGPEVFSSLVQVGPVSGLKLTYSAVGLVWLSSGLVLALLRRPAFRARFGLVAIASFLVLALYANVLRERSEYPDAGDYMRAAFDLSEGRPLHERYIYPPLLAAACELLVPLGRGGMRTALWIGNVLAVCCLRRAAVPDPRPVRLRSHVLPPVSSWPSWRSTCPSCARWSTARSTSTSPT